MYYLTYHKVLCGLIYAYIFITPRLASVMHAFIFGILQLRANDCNKQIAEQ